VSGSPASDIVDAQVHLFTEDGPRYPWDAALYDDPARAGMIARFRERLPHGPTEAMLAEMDAEGVQGALVVSPSIYAGDPSYSVDAWRAHPDRFRVIGLVDAERDDIEDHLASWGEHPGIVGLRLPLGTDEQGERFLAGADDRMLRAAQRAGLGVCVYAPLRFDLRERLARTHPDLQVVIDHVGLLTMAMLDPGYGDTFAEVDRLLPLAAYENVAVKLTSLTLLSREPYPHADVWPAVHAVIEAFGPARLMWGSDQTVFDHPYDEAIDVIRATEEIGPAEKELILGASLRRIWGWPRETA
jgi:predicted TIM-barrel fold metal-dependent hydrolase